jgi:hypothetical protein
MATLKGTTTNLVFGIPSSRASTGVTSSKVQSYTQTDGINTKELRDKNGAVKAIAFFRKTQEISVDFLGTPDADGSGSGTTALLVSAALNTIFHNATAQSGGATECFIDEITLDRSNEDYLKTSVRATTYGVPLS